MVFLKEREREGGRLCYIVTRFGDISPLWQILKAMDNFDRVYFVFGKTLNLLWQLNDAFGQLFIVFNGQILKKLSSHLVTQVRETFARKTLR